MAEMKEIIEEMKGVKNITLLPERRK